MHVGLATAKAVSYQPQKIDDSISLFKIVNQTHGILKLTLKRSSLFLSLPLDYEQPTYFNVVLFTVSGRYAKKISSVLCVVGNRWQEKAQKRHSQLKQIAFHSETYLH